MSFALASTQTGPATPSGLRQPAYARRIHQMRSRGFAPQLGVWIVDGWHPFEDDGQFGDWIIVVPDDVALEVLDFRCIAGLHVFVQAATWTRTWDIAEQAYRFYPKQIWGLPEDRGRRLTYFVPRAA